MAQDDFVQDFNALMPGTAAKGTASRRTALHWMLGAGYAAAAGAVVAQTAITTSSDGLTAGWVDYPVDGFTIPAYRAAPASAFESKSHLPVVLVIQEIFGVHAYIADICRRLAHAGYLAIAPELYVRQGNPAQYQEIGKLIGELVSRVPDAQVMADLDGAVQWAAANGGDTNRLAVTGFCWGGRITWLYAAHAPVKAAVAWYGRLTGVASERTPKHPVDITSRLKAPVLGLYGEKDGGIPLDSVEQMKAALAKGTTAARASRFVIYPDAPHAFHADYRPSYRKQAAEDGFKRALAWFRQQGV